MKKTKRMKKKRMKSGSWMKKRIGKTEPFKKVDTKREKRRHTEDSVAEDYEYWVDYD